MRQELEITYHCFHRKDNLAVNVSVDKGYRSYNRRHLVIFQQILVYLALGFSIDTIKNLLNAETDTTYRF